jgi:galactoside O-acetyltransferase
MLTKLFIEFQTIFTCLLASIPGVSGVKIRNLYYRNKLGNNIFLNIENACVFENTSNIDFKNNVSIGSRARFSAINGSIKCGSNTAFNAGAHINASVGGEIDIGENCLFGPGVSVYSSSHHYLDPNQLIRNQGHKISSVSIGNDCWIGANSIILCGVTIGDGAVIGAGAVVTQNIESFAIAAGVPARVIGKRKYG